MPEFFSAKVSIAVLVTLHSSSSLLGSFEAPDPNNSLDQCTPGINKCSSHGPRRGEFKGVSRAGRGGGGNTPEGVAWKKEVKTFVNSSPDPVTSISTAIHLITCNNKATDS